MNITKAKHTCKQICQLLNQHLHHINSEVFTILKSQMGWMHHRGQVNWGNGGSNLSKTKSKSAVECVRLVSSEVGCPVIV